MGARHGRSDERQEDFAIHILRASGHKPHDGSTRRQSQARGDVLGSPSDARRQILFRYRRPLILPIMARRWIRWREP